MPNDALHDAIGMEIFANRLLAITEEMGVALVRSSFSPNIKERRDCSVALFTANGKVIAQAAHIPIHLGSLLGAVEGVLRDYPLETLKPGDAFVCNDAYLAGGTHLPDIAIVTPVFFEVRQSSLSRISVTTRTLVVLLPVPSITQQRIFLKKVCESPRLGSDATTKSMRHRADRPQHPRT